MAGDRQIPASRGEGDEGNRRRLEDARIQRIVISSAHRVAPYLESLIHLPRASRNRELQNRVHRMFDAPTRRGIESLDGLVPRWPPPGGLHALNSEYPYQVVPGDSWLAPAEAASFSHADVDRFRDLAQRVVRGCDRLLSSVERAML